MQAVSQQACSTKTSAVEPDIGCLREPQEPGKQAACKLCHDSQLQFPVNCPKTTASMKEQSVEVPISNRPWELCSEACLKETYRGRLNRSGLVQSPAHAGKYAACSKLNAQSLHW